MKIGKYSIEIYKEEFISRKEENKDNGKTVTTEWKRKRIW